MFEMLTFLFAGFVTRLLELARDEDLGDGGMIGDLTSLATMTESHVRSYARGS